MLGYNGERCKELGGKTLSSVTINCLYLSRRDVSWCKRHILSSRVSDTGPWRIEGDRVRIRLTEAVLTAQGTLTAPRTGRLAGSHVLTLERNLYSCHSSRYT